MKKIKRVLSIALILAVLVISISDIFALNLPTDPGYNSNNLTNNEVKTKANSFMGTFVYIVQVICVATVVIMGVRYMFSSADGKANIKKEMVVWCVGAFVVFGTTTLVGVVLDIATGNDHVTVVPMPEGEQSVSEWASAEWTSAKDNGLIPSSIKNKPGATISRIEFAECVYKLAEKYCVNLVKPESGITVLDDGLGSARKDVVLKLYNAGIITGTASDENGNIYYTPNAKITREDAATIIYRLLQKSGKRNNTAITDADKSDTLYSEVMEYAKEAMVYMNKNGIIQGTGNSLEPKGNATCEQAVIILHRTYEKHGIGQCSESQEQSTAGNEQTVSDWAAEDWTNANNTGLIPDSIKNKPGATISRIEFAECIYRLADKYNVALRIPESGVTVLDDGLGSTRKNIVLKLYNAGIISGTSVEENGNFYYTPDANITREDVATIIYRLLQKSGKRNTTVVTDEEKANTLYTEVAEYAKEAMVYMNKNGIIQGTGDGLAPKGNTTCEQAVLMLYRTYEKHAN